MKMIIMRTKIVYSLFLLVLIVANQSMAQQVPQTNFYTQNLFSINPAATGIQGNIAGNLNYRDQWSGLKGAPEIATLGVHGMFTSTMGLGINIEQNITGVIKQVNTELNYSYRLPLAEEQSLAFGLKVGITQNSLNYNIMVAGDDTDPTLYSSSPVINESLVRAGFGMHYNRKNLNVHFATPLLYGQQENKFFQTTYGLISYDIFMSEKIWKIQPSVLYRNTQTSKAQIDANIMAEWDKKVWGLVGYRTNQNIVTGVGFFIKNIGLGYSYEVNRSTLSNASSGSHEIMLYFESNYSVAKKDPHFKSSKKALDRF